MTNLVFLIGEGIITRYPVDGDARTLGMDIVAMAALAAAIDEPGSYQVGNQLADFARHRGIKMILVMTSRDVIVLLSIDFMGRESKPETAQSNPLPIGPIICAHWSNTAAEQGRTLPA